MSELFGGAGRYKALRHLFEHADRYFGTRELATASGIDSGNASRWLRRWADIGLLERRIERGQTVFRASQDSSLNPLKLLLRQDGEVVQALKAQLETFEEQIDAAAIFGSVARGEEDTHSDIDVLLIAPALSRLTAQARFKPVGRKLGRPVNVQVFTRAAWQKAVACGDTFVRDILANPVVMLEGVLHAA